MGACKFIHVNAASECKENYSGVGNHLYLFQLDSEQRAAVAYDEKSASFVAASFEGVEMHEIIVKPKTGHVDATSNPDGGGFSNVYEGRVAQNMDKMSLLSRAMNNSSDWGALVSTGRKDEYYVLFDPNFDVEFALSAATGDAPDSDHGHTLTITASPMQYPLCKWSGAITLASDEDSQS